MNVILLHGEDAQKSYARLTKFMDSAKKRGWEIIYDQLPATPSLFGSERLVIFRDYHQVTERDIKSLGKNDGTIVIYHNSEIPPSFVKKMPANFKSEKFDVHKILFTFLESLYPGNAATSIKMLHGILATDPPELVFYFVAKHFRDLYWVSLDPNSTGFPDWKIRKLKSQSSRFSEGQIQKIINDLAEIDIKSKTSTGDLTTLLDLLTLKELE